MLHSLKCSTSRLNSNCTEVSQNMCDIVLSNDVTPSREHRHKHNAPVKRKIKHQCATPPVYCMTPAASEKRAHHFLRPTDSPMSCSLSIGVRVKTSVSICLVCLDNRMSVRCSHWIAKLCVAIE